jgi:hypothetical protein
MKTKFSFTFWPLQAGWQIVCVGLIWYIGLLELAASIFQLVLNTVKKVA